jgi:hypothetical protein
MPVKIFVSYSWDDETLRANVVRTIESVPNVKVILDRRITSPSERFLHKKYMTRCWSAMRFLSSRIFW